MNNEFSFVGEDLERVKQGDASRAEISTLLSDFKSAVQVACMKMCNTLVSFEPNVLGVGAKLSILKSFRSLQRSGSITVYAQPFASGLELFKYEMDPINGYPVTIKYAMRSVRCSDKDSLILGIRAAYENSVSELREWCENGGKSRLNGMIGGVFTTAALSGIANS